MSSMDAVDNMEEMIVTTLGYEEAFKAVSKALSTDTKEDVYSYIVRMYDIGGDD